VALLKKKQLWLDFVHFGCGQVVAQQLNFVERNLSKMSSPDLESDGSGKCSVECHVMSSWLGFVCFC